MRNIFLFVTVLVFCFTGPISCAKTASKKSSPQLVKLYKSPQKDSKVLTTFAPTMRFVPFYRKQGWIKVGVRRDGKVGWINLSQYRNAKRAFYKAKMRSIFVQSTTANGKTRITAYVNGRKVDHKRALAIYKSTVSSNRKARMHMWHMQQRMSRFMRRMMRGFNADYGFGPTWTRFPRPMLQPIVIVVKSNKS